MWTSVVTYSVNFALQLQLGPLPGDLSSEELHSVTGDSSGAASPLTARSMRLERVAQALAQSQEELRRFVEVSFLPCLKD